MGKPYGLTTPCPKCPFRNDIPPFLLPPRVQEIKRSLVRAEFPCHNTIEHDEEGGYVRSGDEMHCAGALILMEKEGQSSQMMRIAERLGMYDRTKLDMAAPVYDSFSEMYDASVEAERGTKRKKRSRR